MNRRLWQICCWLFIFAPAGRPQCDSLLQAGDQAHQAFDVRKAAEYYAQAVRLCPDDRVAMIKYAHTLLDVGEESEKWQRTSYYRQALTIADTLYRRFPCDVDCHYLRAWAIGHVALDISNRERIAWVREYERHLQFVLQKQPSHAPANLALGIFYREMAAVPPFVRFMAELLLGELPNGTFANALLYIEKALQADPQSLAATYELGKTYDMMGMVEKAIYHYQKVLTMAPTDHMDGRKIQSAIKKLSRYGAMSARLNSKMPLN